RGKEFSFRAGNKKPVRVLSRYFYKPFGSAIWVELSRKGISFALTGWFEEGFLNAHAYSGNFKDFEIDFVYRKLPVRITDGVRARLLASGEGSVRLSELKRLLLVLRTEFDGFVKVKKLPKKEKKEEKKLPLEVKLDVEFLTPAGIVVKLPEGRVLASVRGKVKGKLPEPDYRIEVVLKSGVLNYFSKVFYVKRSKVLLLKEEERSLTEFSLRLNTVADDYKIFLNIEGTPDEPRVYYYSVPPLPREELLMKLISGGTQGGVLPIADLMLKEIQAVGQVKGMLERMLDVKIEIGLRTQATGEVGVVTRLKKQIGRFLALYYQVSTSKDKRDTYMGGEARAPVDMELGFRFYMYSDNTREYKLRYTKEFDF
ncbi:MAG: hypothetical protein GXO04_04275, partial [Aquificae bacterium]|nr:hypothetical protein [Aquificota bacterium]